MRHTGPGLLEKRPTNPPSFLLYNFDIDGSQVKKEHQRALFSMVMPALRSGGSVCIVGLASRSGSMAHNDLLSLERAKNVLKVLRQNVPAGFSTRLYSGKSATDGQVSGVGERKAKLEGYRDGTEDARFRAVLVFAWPGALPPKLRLPGDVLLREIPEVTSGNEDLELLVRALDTLAGTGKIVELVVESAFLEVAVGIVETIGIVLSLPAAWLAGAHASLRNGRLLGFSRAMQAMADAMGGTSSAADVGAVLPPIPHPFPQQKPIPDPMLSQADQLAREGERQGYEMAWSLVMRLERNPKEVTLTVRGNRRTMRLSGRGLLWCLHRAFGDSVKEEIQRRNGWE